MLVSDIKARLLNQINDSDQTSFDDATIFRWINDGMRELAVSNDLLQKKGTLVTVTGTSVYSWPADVLQLHSVKWKGLKLKALSMQEADDLLPTPSTTTYPVGTPTSFWVWAGQLNLWPAPDAGDATSLTVFYTKVPTEVAANGDTPEIPVQYHNRLVEYCIAQAAEADGDMQLAAIKMQQFQTGSAATKDSQSWEERDFYPSVTALPGDYGTIVDGQYPY